MDQGERTVLFDKWAADYDKSVRTDREFPFAGYESVLDEIVISAGIFPGITVLDLGTGTGNLAAAL